MEKESWWSTLQDSLKTVSCNVNIVPGIALYEDNVKFGKPLIVAYFNNEPNEKKDQEKSLIEWQEIAQNSIVPRDVPLVLFNTEEELMSWYFSHGYRIDLLDEAPEEMEYIEIGNDTMDTIRQRYGANLNFSHMYLSKFIYHDIQGYCEEVPVCVAVHVFHKGILLFQDQVFPKSLQVRGHDIYIDVREGGLQDLMQNQNNNNIEACRLPIRIGTQISTPTDYGTIGCFVKDINQKIGIITAAHVTLKNKTLEEPGEAEWCLPTTLTDCYGNTLQTFSENANQMQLSIDKDGTRNDIVVIWTGKTLSDWTEELFQPTVLTNSNELRLGICDVKIEEWDRKKLPYEYNEHKYYHTVLKVGATTGRTEGKLLLSKAWVSTNIRVWKITKNINNFKPSWRNCYLVQSEEKPVNPLRPNHKKCVFPFSDVGDSGSMVFVKLNEDTHNDDVVELYPIGFVLGSVCQNKKWIVVFPLQHIRDELAQDNISIFL